MLTPWPILYCCRLQALPSLPGQQLPTVSSCCRRPPVPVSTFGLTMLGAPQWCRRGHSRLRRLRGPLVSGGLASCELHVFSAKIGLECCSKAWLLWLSLYRLHACFSNTTMMCILLFLAALLAGIRAACAAGLAPWPKPTAQISVAAAARGPCQQVPSAPSPARCRSCTRHLLTARGSQQVNPLT